MQLSDDEIDDYASRLVALLERFGVVVTSPGPAEPVDILEADDGSLSFEDNGRIAVWGCPNFGLGIGNQDEPLFTQGGVFQPANGVVQRAAPQPSVGQADIAEVFMNFLLRPEVAAANANALGLSASNTEVMKPGLLDKALLNNTALYPDAIVEKVANHLLEWILHFADQKINAAHDRAYNEVLAK